MRVWLSWIACVTVACSSSGTWRRVDTPNFVLRTDLDSSDAKHAAVALEVSRDALVSAAWPSVDFNGEKTEVFVLASGLDFERTFGRHLAGLFLHGPTPQFFLYGSADRWELRRSAHFPTRSVLRHEMAHNLAAHVWPDQPRWFAEGLADFLEPVYYSEDNSVVVGGVNYDAYAWYRSVRTVTVEDAIAWNDDALDIKAHRQTGGLYGISWLLFHWLFNRHPQELVNYMNALHTGTPPAEALRAALPSIDLATIDKELYEYQRHGKFDELPRPWVETKISESMLQDHPLDSAGIAYVKEVLARASKRNKPSHRDTTDTSGTEAEIPRETKPARPVIDYEKLPPLAQYPCSGPPKDATSDQAAPESTTLPAGEKQRASRTGAPPAKKTAGNTASAERRGRLAPEVIQRTVRASYSKFRGCYEEALKRNPNLGGRVTVRFVIARDGSVGDVAPNCTTLPDPAAVQCIVERYRELKFPKPEGDGIVTVVYPIMFTPGD